MDKTVAISPYPGKEADAARRQKKMTKRRSLRMNRKREMIIWWDGLSVSGERIRGRGYRLHQGFNRLGRASHMDIQVTDATVPRTAVSVVYDDRSNLFYAVQMESSALFKRGLIWKGQLQLVNGRPHPQPVQRNLNLLHFAERDGYGIKIMQAAETEQPF